MQYYGRYADYIMQRNAEKRCVPQSRWLWARDDLAVLPPLCGPAAAIVDFDALWLVFASCPSIDSEDAVLVGSGQEVIKARDNLSKT